MFAMKMQQVRCQTLGAPFGSDFVDPFREIWCVFTEVIRVYWTDGFGSGGEFGTDIFPVSIAFIEVKAGCIVVFVEVYSE